MEPPQCFIIEDDIVWARELLKPFETLRRPDIFTVVFLGNLDRHDELCKSLDGVACVVGEKRSEQFKEDPRELVKYLAKTFRPGNFYVVDDNLTAEVGLAERGGPLSGVQTFRDALKEVAPSDTRDHGHRSMTIFFITIDKESSMHMLAAFPRWLERAPEFLPKDHGMRKLTDKIELWRADHGLTGKGPGPTAEEFRTGHRQLTVAFEPVLNLHSWRIEAQGVVPWDEGTNAFPRAAILDAVALGGRHEAEWDDKVLDAFRSWMRRAEAEFRRTSYAVTLSPTTFQTDAFVQKCLAPAGMFHTDWPVPPDRITLRIRCSEQGLEGAPSVDLLKPLRQAGYRIGFDARETKASHLPELLDPAVDEVAVDQRIVITCIRSRTLGPEWTTRSTSFSNRGGRIVAIWDRPSPVKEVINKLREASVGHVQVSANGGPAKRPLISLPEKWKMLLTSGFVDG